MAQHKSYDPEDVRDLRGELLRAGKLIMSDEPKDIAKVKKWTVLKKEYVLKVGSRVLPVLNAGKDDDSDLIPAGAKIRIQE